MKKTILKIALTILLFTTYISPLLSQEKLSYVTMENDNLTWILNRVKILKEFSADTLFIRVLEVTNESGSAGFANCEVTSTIYVAVSEYGEYPDQKLYKLTPVYNPKIDISGENSYSPIIYLSYGSLKNPKKYKIEISLNKLNLIRTSENQRVVSTDTLNISGNTILFFCISQQKYDSLSSNEKSEIDEVLSDFNFYTDKLIKSLSSQNIKTQYISKKKYVLKYENDDLYVYDRNDFNHIVGAILINGKTKPKILSGVYTDIGYQAEINDYFK